MNSSSTSTRRALAADVARERQQHGHGGLVVGAEDPLVGVLPAAVHEHRLDGRLRAGRCRGGRRAAPSAPGCRSGGAAGAGRGIRASRLPQSEPIGAAGVVLVDLDAERAQLGDHALGAGALAPGGALDAAELGERAVQVAALERAGLSTRAALERVTSGRRAR